MLGIAPASAELFCSPGNTLPGGQHQNAPPGVLVSSSIYGFFKSDGEDPRDLGTNPNLTGVTWSTTEYIDTNETYGIVHGNIDRLFVKMKSAYDLNRMAYPPPNPFYVTATLSMENDEGETVTGCDFVFGTSYAPQSGRVRADGIGYRARRPDAQDVYGQCSGRTDSQRVRQLLLRESRFGREAHGTPNPRRCSITMPLGPVFPTAFWTSPSSPPRIWRRCRTRRRTRSGSRSR